MSRRKRISSWIVSFFEAIGRAEAQRSGAVFLDRQDADAKRYTR